MNEMNHGFNALKIVSLTVICFIVFMRTITALIPEIIGHSGMKYRSIILPFRHISVFGGTNLHTSGNILSQRHAKLNFRLISTTCLLEKSSNDAYDDIDAPVTISNAKAISWYPGHIAKAERELADYLTKVDVVIEVRDARIPLSTTHPKVPEWVGNRPLIVAIARLDQVSKRALAAWKEYYTVNPVYPERPETKVFFIDGRSGDGVMPLKKEALKASKSINERRQRRGIQPRAVRAAVIGFPNVGKSALINRLLGRKMAKSRNLPGVTRSLQWVRLGGLEGPQDQVIELLDSPGIIPARQFDQGSALKLAICNDIGEASYDRVVVAGFMCNYINELHRKSPGFVSMRTILERYEFPFHEMDGEEIVYQFAENKYQGNLISSADKLLSDFRKNLLGFGSLESPPRSVDRALSSGSKAGKPVRFLRASAIGSSVHDDERVEGDVDTETEKSGDDLHQRGNKLSGDDSSEGITINSSDNNDTGKVDKHSDKKSNKNSAGKGVSDESISQFEVGKGNYDGW